MLVDALRRDYTPTLLSLLCKTSVTCLVISILAFSTPKDSRIEISLIICVLKYPPIELLRERVYLIVFPSFHLNAGVLDSLFSNVQFKMFLYLLRQWILILLWAQCIISVKIHIYSLQPCAKFKYVRRVRFKVVWL